MLDPRYTSPAGTLWQSALHRARMNSDRNPIDASPVENPQS